MDTTISGLSTSNHSRRSGSNEGNEGNDDDDEGDDDDKQTTTRRQTADVVSSVLQQLLYSWEQQFRACWSLTESNSRRHPDNINNNMATSESRRKKPAVSTGTSSIGFLLPGGHAHVVWEHGENNKATTTRRNFFWNWTTALSGGGNDDDHKNVTAASTTCTKSPVPKIYLGSRKAVQKRKTLEDAGIRAIVNCTQHIPCHHRTTSTTSTTATGTDDKSSHNNKNNNNNKMKYAQVPIHDKALADLLMYLPSITAFLRYCLTRSQVSVLVHCRAGVSRSSSVVLAYLVEYEHMTLEEAYALVKRRRPQIYPNSGFWTQLQSYEIMCRGRRQCLFPEQPPAPEQPDRHNNSDCTKIIGIPALTLPSPSLPCKSNSSGCSFGSIDQDWMKQSIALYSTCRDLNLPGNTFHTACFGQLLDFCRDCYYSQNNKREDKDESSPQAANADQIHHADQIRMDPILIIALDFVCGRGVLVVECEWLAELCDSLDQMMIIHSNSNNEDSGCSSVAPTKASSKPGTAAIRGNSPVGATGCRARVAILLTDPHSTFRLLRTGEMDPKQVDCVMTVLRLYDKNKRKSWKEKKKKKVNTKK